MMPFAFAARRKRRVMFTERQVAALNELFAAKRYLSAIERENVAGEIGLIPTQVKIWFQNRRYKQRRDDRNFIFGLNGAIGNGRQQHMNNGNIGQNGDDAGADDMDGEMEEEEDVEEIEERASRNRYKLLRLLPVETWLQIFDGMPRVKLARSAASALKLFAYIAAPRIYGQQVWPRLLQEFYICQENGTTVATYVNVNQAILTLPYTLDLPFPAKLSTSSFTNLKEITICHLDDQVHHFLRAITPFLAGSVLKFSSISSGNPNPNIPAKEVEMFGQWAADVKIKSATICGPFFMFLYKNCQKMFRLLSLLEVTGYYNEYPPCFFDAIVELLAKREAQENGQQQAMTTMMIFKLNSSIENASKLIAMLKEQFLCATTPCPFVLKHSPDECSIPFALENKKTREQMILVKRKGEYDLSSYLVRAKKKEIAGLRQQMEMVDYGASKEKIIRLKLN